MPRGDKSSYTTRQKRRARKIEESYEKRGVSGREAARRGKRSPKGRSRSGSSRSRASR